MKTGFAVLVGVGALTLAMGVGGASAATPYHHRMAASHARQASEPARSQSSNLATNGNNPAKRYEARHMPEGSIKTSTLTTNGNNPAKPYSARHMPENAIHEATLPTNGNNGVKLYKSTTTGAAPR